MSKLDELKAKLLGSTGDATPKAAELEDGNAGQPSYKQQLPAIIDQYRVSWESVVGDLSSDIASRLHQLPALEQQLKDWEMTTKATMQALLNEHANKYC
jgi:hypothetical protein